MRRSGVRIPLAPPQTDIRSRMSVFCMPGRVRAVPVVVLIGAAGVRGACWAGLWGRAAVCAGGRRPAREPSAPRASLGASPRSPARPRRRPRAPQPGPQGSLYPSVSATPGKQINMILCLDARQLSTLPSSIGTRHIG